MESLLLLHASKKQDIKDRLAEFKKAWERTDAKVFAELCFCILTPQSKATACDRAVDALFESDLLFTGTAEAIAPILSQYGTRFANNKANYIVEARRYFSEEDTIKIKSKLNTDDVSGLRNWLAENVKGLGYKEASHFLRNIGFGENFAILDRHVLKNLIRYKIIDEIPTNLTRQRYLEIEDKIRKFSEKIKIPMDELDLLFWSEEAGQIFK